MEKAKFELNESNKKGYILSLDALVAAILVISVFSSLLFYQTRNEENLQKLSIAKTGSDVVTLFEKNNVLASRNQQTIQSNLNNLTLPYQIWLNITYAEIDLNPTTNILIGNQTEPQRGFISTGKRFFTVVNGTNVTHFGVVNYKIWEK